MRFCVLSLPALVRVGSLDGVRFRSDLHVALARF